MYQRFFFKNGISQLLTLAQALRNSCSSNTKSAKGERHENMRHKMSMSIRLETSEASEGWGPQEDVGHEHYESTQVTKTVN